MEMSDDIFNGAAIPL